MKEKKKMKKGKKIFLIIFLSFFTVCLSSGLFLLYGPYNGFRDWLITTAMTTMNHQYLATIFYSEETINEVLERNKVIEPNENTDTDLIDINNSNIDTTTYKNSYEKEILEREEDDLYKIIDIKGNGYSGYMAVIYDPSKIKLAVSSKLGTSGEYLVDMAKREDAIIAINGGGFFDDEKGEANGGTAAGPVIKDGKIVSNVGNPYSGGIIGFTYDNKLYLGKVSASVALEENVRDAVSFGPFLIVNGTPAFITGNGGYGLHPRSAIGQRQDGIVLFLVIDGRSLTSQGVDMVELTRILQNYGAYNAANLDGGNSSALVVDGEIINHPLDYFGQAQTRPIPNGFIVVE